MIDSKVSKVAMFVAGMVGCVAAHAQSTDTVTNPTIGPFVRWGVEDPASGEFRFGVPTPFDTTPVDDGKGGLVYKVARGEFAGAPALTASNNGELEATVSFSVEMKTDPYILFSFTVTDFGAPSVFTFSALNPLLPNLPDGNYLVKSAFGGTLTDFTGNGAGIAKVGAGPIQTSTVLPGPVGMTVDVGPDMSMNASGYSGTSATYGDTPAPLAAAFVNPGLTFGDYKALALSGGSFTQMQGDWKFQLSGGGDTFSGTGYIEITPVPEPSAVAMMLAGLGVIGAAARRRSARA